MDNHSPDPRMDIGMEAETTVEGKPTRRATALRIAAVAGGLALPVCAFSVFSWAPSQDAAVILMLVFVLLLIGYAVLAVFGVRAGVVAPFVVAALLLPWVCVAAALLGIVQRADSLIDEFSKDFSDTSSLQETAPSLPVESEAAVPSEGEEALPAQGEEAAPSDEEVFPAPPSDAAPAVALGAPVTFEQELGPEGEVAPWAVTVTDVECGLKALSKGEYTDDGVGTATPRSGYEFCLVETRWKNVGDAEAGGATVLGNLVAGDETVERLDKDVSRGLAVMTGRDVFPDSVVKPGKSTTLIDVFEVPDGVAPDAVWISRDQPKVLAALK